MRRRNHAYTQERKVVKIAKGVLAAARRSKQHNTLLLFLHLKSINANGQIPIGKSLHSIYIKYCLKSFSVASFYKHFEELKRLEFVAIHNNTIHLISHDKCTWYFLQKDPKKVKHFSIDKKHFDRGTVIEAIEATEIYYNKAQQKKAIVSIHADGQYVCEEGSSAAFVEYYSKVIEKDTERLKNKGGLQLAELPDSIPSQNECTQHTVNYSTNVSLQKYCSLLGISTRSLVSMRLKHLTRLRFITCYNRNQDELLRCLDVNVVSF